MPNYAVMNPGKYRLGVPFNFPPLANKRLRQEHLIKQIKWKTSVLIGQRLYLGNVKLVDKHNKERILSDSVFKSRAGQFDTFTMDRRIDVAVNDGEEIIRLATYADRLLQYKQNTLYIINATKSQEFLEATHKHKGVSHHNAVCETDFGVAWCNQHGVYLYNGRQVGDLLVKEGVRFISESLWNSFYVDGETMIGFSPKSKQLVIIKSFKNSTNNSGDILVYDMVTSSWVKGTARLNAEDKTNLINMWDGSLIYGFENTPNQTTIVPWQSNPTEAINNFNVQFKELNFGTQAKKKVIKIELTYRGASGGNTNVLPKYSVDGGAYNNNFLDSSGSQINNIPGSADFTVIELFTQSNANNIKTFSIKFEDVSGQNVSADFEINDMSIILRQKSIK
tara:strand:- start:251 stop:1429 length:1179 start_codon:yes stop_codon:yes gene_type:complete